MTKVRVHKFVLKILTSKNTDIDAWEIEDILCAHDYLKNAYVKVEPKSKEEIEI